MSYYKVTLDFDQEILSSKKELLKKELYHHIFTIEWFFKSINTEQIIIKKNQALVYFYTTYESKLSWAESQSIKAFKGHKRSTYLNDTLKCINLNIKRYIIPGFKKAMKEYKINYSNSTNSKQRNIAINNNHKQIKQLLQKFKKKHNIPTYKLSKKKSARVKKSHVKRTIRK